MNDRRFIELLNLYVDQELSPDQARELEQEIAHRPDRRRIYGQYCRMQRACVRLLEQQAAPAPRLAELRTATTTASDAEPVTIIQLPEDEVFRSANRGRRGLVWMTWGSGLVATAACVALTLVLLREPAGSAGASTPMATIATPEPTPANAASASTPAFAATEAAVDSAAPARGPSYRPAVVLTDLQRGNSDQLVNSPNRIGQPSLEWLIERRLTPIRRLPLEAYPYDVLTNESGPMFVNERTDGTVPTESITFEFRR